MPQPLPIGLQSFKALRKGGYLYVDKTEHIAKLITAAKYQFLARPRRFGKSLLVDTMHQLFAGERELFAGLWIEKRWDWTTAYPVVRITMGNAATTNGAELTLYLETTLLEEAARHEVLLEHNLAGLMFRSLLLALHAKYHQPVVVLVDEYDKPILDNMTNLAAAHECRDVLKGFYGALKGADEVLKFVFLTGVTKFSKVSLFSGLNNLNDITLDESFGTICGITHQELLKTFPDYIDDVDLEQVSIWYNGYNFLGKERVYNPFDLILYFDSKKLKNYWFETATPTFLINLLKERNYYIPKLERLNTNEELLGSFDLDQINVETLLFQTGYLTIREQHRIGEQLVYTLHYPNLEIKMSLTKSILKAFVFNNTDRAENNLVLHQALLESNLEQLEKSIRSIFAAIPYDWLRKNRLTAYEGYYASVFYSYVCGLGLSVTAEDMTSRGRIDLVIELKKSIFIIEFKTEASGKGALEQIKEKRYWEKYASRCKPMYLVGIEFSEKERNVSEFSWEMVK